MTDRHTLEADLLRHQEAGDLAMQADTWLALADIAYKEDEAYRLAQGLYGQAWDAYDQLGDTRAIAGVIMALTSLLPRIFWDDDGLTDESWIDMTHLYDMALRLYIELGNQREIADTYSTMGYSNLYPDDVATRLLEQALDLYTRLEDIPEQLSILQTLTHRYEFKTPAFWECLDKVLTIYRSANDKEGEVSFLRQIYEFRMDDPEVQPFIERAFDLYRQLEDVQGEANLYIIISHAYRRNEHYDVARSTLETAYHLFKRSENYEAAFGTRCQIARIVAVTDGYEVYLRYYQDILQEFRIRPNNKYYYFLFKQLCEMAQEHDDWPTARHGFQQIIAALWADSEQQAETYWQWGQIEAYQAGHLHMGFMLCQRAVMVFDRCLPGQNRYHRRLRHMRRELKLFQYKRLKS